MSTSFIYLTKGFFLQNYRDYACGVVIGMVGAYHFRSWYHQGKVAEPVMVSLFALTFSKSCACTPQMNRAWSSGRLRT